MNENEGHVRSVRTAEFEDGRLRFFGLLERLGHVQQDCMRLLICHRQAIERCSAFSTASSLAYSCGKLSLASLRAAVMGSVSGLFLIISS